MNKKEKNEFIDVLNNMLEENKNFYLTDIAGLTAEESSSLRRMCYKQNVTIQVVKNTLSDIKYLNGINSIIYN